MKYLLDTNICIALIRQRPAGVLRHLLAQQPGEVGISTITLAELTYGVEKSVRVAPNRAALEQFLLPLELLDFDARAAEVYGRIRTELERGGQPIGAMDLLIAAHALSLGLILITNNQREFQRVAGLALEDWMS